MRILLAALLLALGALAGAPARAADMPEYPEFQVPEVDYGLGGGFYLRGSGALNMLWARDSKHDDGCGCLETVSITANGYGYSLGAGFGYETGNGLRFDGTLDYLYNTGLEGGGHVLTLRSTIALANVYYDFPLSGMGSAGGGWGGYVGAGLGGGYMQTKLTAPLTPDGANFAPVAAAMAGVTYDMGNWVADVGYRGLYIPQLTNGDAGPTPYYVNQNLVSEIRGTLRYRLQ